MHLAYTILIATLMVIPAAPVAWRIVTDREPNPLGVHVATSLWMMALLWLYVAFPVG